MTFDIGLVLGNTLSGILQNLPWFLLVIWAVGYIGRRMPSWIEQYEKIKEHERKIAWAKSIK